MSLQPLQVHSGAALVVAPFDLGHVGAIDPEERHAPSVRPAHMDVDQLAAAYQPEGRQIDVLGHKHALTSFRRLDWERKDQLQWRRVGGIYPLLAGPASGHLPRFIPTSVRFRFRPSNPEFDLVRKPCQDPSRFEGRGL